MYDNERGTGLGIFNILGKIIFVIIFVLLMIWLYKKVPNMTPFYNNVFRENISYMQNAAENHFTNERLPKVVGEEVKLTLQEMINQNLIIPFVDEDGNSCNINESYVSVTKNTSDYTLKINLVCDNEEDYIIETLGCYDKCEGNCTQEKIEKITEYQFKKASKKTTTSCKCEKDFVRKDGACYKSVISSKIPATKIFESDSYLIYDATVVEGKSTTTYADYIVTPGAKNLKCADPSYSLDSSTKKCTKIVDAKYREGSTYTTEEAAIQKGCTTIKTTGTKSGSEYSYIKSQFEYTCSNHINCPNQVLYNYYSYCPYTCSEGTLTQQKTCIVEHTTPGSWYCSKGDPIANNKCLLSENALEEEGTKSYSCPSGYLKSGETTNTICSKTIKEPNTYVCEKEGDLLVGTKCNRFIKGQFKYNECPKDQGYTLDGEYCYKTTDEKKALSCTKITKKVYSYKWAKTKTLVGWTFTGKTKTVEK